MGIKPLAAVSVDRIIEPCRCGGQGILARGNDDFYLRKARLGGDAARQPAAAVPTRWGLPAAPRTPTRRAAGRPLRDRPPAARGAADRPGDAAGAGGAVSAPGNAAGKDGWHR